jgi:hypothetical protein
MYFLVHLEMLFTRQSNLLNLNPAVQRFQQNAHELLGRVRATDADAAQDTTCPTVTFPETQTC